MLLAADFSLMCRLPSASVLIGQEAVMTKPALTKPVASASQAPLALWVNMTVMAHLRQPVPSRRAAWSSWPRSWACTPAIRARSCPPWC